MKSLFALLVLFLSLSIVRSSVGQDAIVIDGGTLIDVVTGGINPDSRVVINGGVITHVGRDVDIPAGAMVIDAAGKYIIPGLADMHVHFSLGLPQPRIDDETKIVLHRLLYYGVTSVLNLGASDGSSDNIKTYRQLIDATSIAGPYIYGTGGHINIPGTHPIETIFPPHVRDFADKLVLETPLDSPADLTAIGIAISLVRTEAAARKAVRERATGGMNAIKITIERGPTEFGNHHPIMPDSIITAIVDEAEKYGLPVFAHVSSLVEFEAARRCGVSGIVHAVAEPPYPSVSAIAEMVRSNFYVMPTLALYETFIRYLEDEQLLNDSFLLNAITDNEISIYRDAGFLDAVPEDSLKLWRWYNEQTIASIGDMHEAGVNIVAGTDVGNPMVFAGWAIHLELQKLVDAGLSPLEALRSATIRAAAMISKEMEFGSIEVGKRGDVLILDANPLENIANTKRISTVIANGRVVQRDALQISF